jgi:quercetin dioxygenase-like cupin family protein
VFADSYGSFALNWRLFREKLASMSNTLPAWRFVSFNEAEVEPVPPGKTHFWQCKPGMVRDTNLMFVRCQLEPGAAHKFHFHPKMEEILYILSGTAEQWVEKDKKIMKAGDMFYVPAGVIHATFNAGSDKLDFLAILSPAQSEGPVTVEVGDKEPWNSLKK